MTTSPPQTPAADVTIDETLARQLLTEQCANLAPLPLSLLGEGWDNVSFRLGENWVVRLPRRQLAASLIKHEHTWLNQLPPLPLPIPIPIFHGEATLYYPYSWSVVPYIQGSNAAQQALDDSQALVLADFLRALHQTAPTDAPSNPYRGVPLNQRSATVAGYFKMLDDVGDRLPPAIKDHWYQSLTLPSCQQRRWLHADLHPLNILANDGKITGIIDWGDITSGDVATDLAALWLLFSPELAADALAHYEADPDTCVRARAWAVLFALTLYITGTTNNLQQAGIGKKLLAHLGQ